MASNNAVDGTTTAAFILSIIGGIFMIAASGMMASHVSIPYYAGMMGAYSGMMGGYYGMMGGYSGMMPWYASGSWFYGVLAIGVLAGIVVLIGAIMLYARPAQSSTWGILILVFSSLALFGMGGFFLGAILGAVGGALALVGQRH